MRRGEENIWGTWRTLKEETESIYGSRRWRKNLYKGLRITLGFEDRNWTLPKRQEMFIPLRELIPETFKAMGINRKEPNNYNDNGHVGSTETRNLMNSRWTVSFLRRLFSVEFAVKLAVGQILFVYSKTFDFLLAIIIPQCSIFSFVIALEACDRPIPTSSGPIWVATFDPARDCTLWWTLSLTSSSLFSLRNIRISQHRHCSFI